VGGFPDLNGLASTGVARPGIEAQNFSRQMDADKFVPQQTRKRYIKNCFQNKNINQIMKTKTLTKSKWYLRFAFALAGVIASNNSALGVTFNFGYQPGTTQEQIKAVELAGNIWSSYLKDTNVVVNIHFGMTNGVLPNGVLGGATPGIKKMNYDKFKLGLAADGTANINLLPTSNQSSDKYSVKLQNGSINRNFYELLQTTANNKALGNDLSGHASGLDGYIQLQAGINWSYDYAQGTVQNNSFDFVSVVLHEIGHNLGFISSIDVTSNGNNLVLPTFLDMFRYSDASAAQGAIDFSVDSMRRYFSTDGGQSVFTVTETEEIVGNNGTTQTVTTTYEALLARGKNTSLGGDGMQASHWADANPDVGIMNPLVENNTIRKITKVDLAAMDYIGWDVDYSAQLDMNALLQNAQTKASNAVIQDRRSDVQQMMASSQIYNMGGSGWCDPFLNPACSWWQQGDTNTAVSVPEPSATMGLLGLFGIAALSKRRGKKNCRGDNSTLQ
jgi:PEP-CTERM motif